MDEELRAERSALMANGIRNFSMYMPMFALKPDYNPADESKAMRWWPTPRGIGGPHP